MRRIGVCAALGLTLAGIIGADDPEIARLKAQVERLEAENKALKSDAEARVDIARLGLDVRLLHHLQESTREKPDDRSLKTDAADLAERIAPHSKGNRTVGQVLLDTKVLEDGMTVEHAEELLGPATEKSPERLGWYYSSICSRGSTRGSGIGSARMNSSREPDQPAPCRIRVWRIVPKPCCGSTMTTHRKQLVTSLVLPARSASYCSRCSSRGHLSY